MINFVITKFVCLRQNPFWSTVYRVPGVRYSNIGCFHPENSPHTIDLPRRTGQGEKLYRLKVTDTVLEIKEQSGLFSLKALIINF